MMTIVPVVATRAATGTSPASRAAQSPGRRIDRLDWHPSLPGSVRRIHSLVAVLTPTIHALTSSLTMSDEGNMCHRE